MKLKIDGIFLILKHAFHGSLFKKKKKKHLLSPLTLCAGTRASER